MKESDQDRERKSERKRQGERKKGRNEKKERKKEKEKMVKKERVTERVIPRCTDGHAKSESYHYLFLIYDVFRVHSIIQSTLYPTISCFNEPEKEVL